VTPFEPLPGYDEPKPMVFSGVYPAEGGEFERLHDSIHKLKLNDASLVFEPDSSHVMGLGFRCGFLGLLHMDIFTERMNREYDCDVILTAPSVVYKCILRTGQEVYVGNPTRWPNVAEIKQSLEPYSIVEILCPPDCIGGIMDLCHGRRGVRIEEETVASGRAVKMRFEMPLSEVITDFFNSLKSVTRGYGSMDYQISDYRETDLVKLEIKLNGVLVPPLTTICTRASSYKSGKKLAEALKAELPRHQFKIAVQACVGSSVIASAQISPFRKDVTANCSGGDATRKQKLLRKQAEGKKKLRQFGSVSIPAEVLTSLIRIN